MTQIRSQRLQHEKKHLTPWHRHEGGQIYLLTRGMLAMELPGRQWAITGGTLGWLPPGCAHQALACGDVAGWSLYLPVESVPEMPPQPQLFTASVLLQALVERIAQFPAGPLSAQQRRLLQVLLDEMHAASRAPLQLPLPQDARLLNIARALLNDPASLRSQRDWAAWAGLSPRTLSRRFQQETGISFALWRQQARVLRSLEGLSRGAAVGEVADACGYDNVSAYIAAFRRRFGITPGAYFAPARQTE
ncbi:helix-turn-helix domain-containing protein [Serratia marcescens]|uniref:helix-turn-helix domain-containing protein n=1 Tax=Serratia marcescens TaxID=615 RepID=UPI0027E4B742|nr:helix-turn-helix transcriptional regulator [Serratia marcescens]